MRGEKVIVRAYGGEYLIRFIWEVTPEAVYICSEENYTRLSAGLSGLDPVGFPKDAAYMYDADIAEFINKETSILPENIRKRLRLLNRPSSSEPPRLSDDQQTLSWEEAHQGAHTEFV